MPGELEKPCRGAAFLYGVGAKTFLSSTSSSEGRMTLIENALSI